MSGAASGLILARFKMSRPQRIEFKVIYGTPSQVPGSPGRLPVYRNPTLRSAERRCPFSETARADPVLERLPRPVHLSQALSRRREYITGVGYPGRASGRTAHNAVARWAATGSMSACPTDVTRLCARAQTPTQGAETNASSTAWISGQFNWTSSTCRPLITCMSHPAAASQ
jgi:hypothetical protein